MCALPTKTSSQLQAPVPAGIERALAILQILGAHPDGLRHSEIVAISGASKTAITRVLSHLEHLSYIKHSNVDHRYRSAELSHQLSPLYSPQLNLLQHSQTALQNLSNINNWSAALIYWTGDEAICLTRINAPGNCELQRPGHITRGIVDNPYHVFFLSQLQWRRMHRDSTDLAHGLNHAWYHSESLRLKQDGYTMANNGKKLRIAAPLYRGKHCVGAVLLGHHDKKQSYKALAKKLKTTCQNISELLEIKHPEKELHVEHTELS